MESQLPGEIITFYSYKGGTGRTMSLANVACILAERLDNKSQTNGGKGVLMIDWDLEAPGLHRYFQNKLASKKKFETVVAVGSDVNYDAEPGLIDLFYDFSEVTDKFLNERESTEENLSLSYEKLAHDVIENVDLEKYIIPTRINKLSLLKAGCFKSTDGADYSERVNKFNWESIYQKSPHLMRVFAEKLAEQYDYVLIDSRTGVTDISSVCTALLPEKLVVVFTPNAQSLDGALDIVRRATKYRKESADLRPLLVFPLVSRVETSEPGLKHDWRVGNPEKKINGYQPEFEKVLKEVYEEEQVKLKNYFSEMQIQHIPRYAYGEEVAILIERSEDRLSLGRSYRTFTQKLVESYLPWEGKTEEVGPGEEAIITFADSFAKRASELFNSPSFKTALITAMIITTFLGVFALYQYQKAAAANIALEKENVALEQELSKLQNFSEVLKEKEDVIKKRDETITELYVSSGEKDTTITDLQDQLKQVNNKYLLLQKTSGSCSQQLRNAQAEANEEQKQTMVCLQELQVCRAKR